MYTLNRSLCCRLVFLLAGALALMHCDGSSSSTPPTQALPLSSKAYFIGNSLIWDMNPPWLEEIAQTRNVSLATAYHIDCGA